MRSHNDLFEKITSFENLVLAAKLAQRGKRFKNKTAYFNFRKEQELLTLQKQLLDKTYEPGRYKNFKIYEPKQRLISAAPYRDRVVHHAIHNILEPIFEPTFIHDSYATRKNKGTHAALNQFQKFARKNFYVLKSDIKKYFPSIDQKILLGLIEKKIACPDTIWLIKKILDSSNNMALELQPSPAQPSPAQPSPAQPSPITGIPIGNLTSQFFANIYLNGFDHHVKQNLGCRYYIRYMDNFVIFYHDKNFLRFIREKIIEYLKTLRLSVHDNKTRIYKTSGGVPFLGMTVFPTRRRIKRQNLIRFKKRLRRFERDYQSDEFAFRHVHQSIQSWIGHVSHADTWKLRELVFGDFVLQKREGN